MGVNLIWPDKGLRIQPGGKMKPWSQPPRYILDYHSCCPSPYGILPCGNQDSLPVGRHQLVGGVRWTSVQVSWCRLRHFSAHHTSRVRPTPCSRGAKNAFTRKRVDTALVVYYNVYDTAYNVPCQGAMGLKSLAPPAIDAGHHEVLGYLAVVWLADALGLHGGPSTLCHPLRALTTEGFNEDQTGACWFARTVVT